MDSVIVRHEACPSCRRMGKDKHGDNLGVYSDGHKWCFACSHSEFPSMPRLTTVEAPPRKHQIGIPDDADNAYSAKALTWLSKYDIEFEEIRKYKLLWSEKRNYLIFPFYDESGNLLMWQARCFGENAPRKWLTFGSTEKIVPWDLTHNTKAGIILVEDVISGIKIQRQFDAYPIFGSYLTANRLIGLKYFTDRLIFWLDYDKRKEALKFAALAQSLGFKTQLVVTELDPKEYTNLEIKDFVNEVNDIDVPF